MPFTEVFGNNLILPSNATFLALALSADVELQWPIEQAINDQVVADLIEVTATGPGLSITIPDARQVSQGYTATFNNIGAQTVTVNNAVGGTLVSLVSGTVWVLYLADNSTEAGLWRIFQLGASVSVAVAAALAGAGLKAIATTLNQSMPVQAVSVTPVNVLDANRATLFNWTSGLGDLNLPTAASVGSDWYIQVRNSGSGNLTVAPSTGQIDGAATKTFAPGSSGFVVTDGTDYFTVGFGSGASGGGSFDFVEIDVSGSGDFVLSGANLNRIAYRFIGVLTGTRNIVVPNTTQQYWVTNGTTGAFSLFIKTAAQSPGVEVLQSNSGITYCDGTNVLDAESSTVSFPIPVVQGGTGAINATTARTNLGATVTGSALFTAVDAAAARTAIAAVPTTRLISTATGLTGGGDLSSDRPLAIDFGIVGRALMASRTIASSDSTVASDLGGSVLYTGSGGHTFTGDADLPATGLVTIRNRGTGGLIIAASVVLRYMSGTGILVTGSKTLPVGGIFTLYHIGAGEYEGWGVGAS